MKRKTRFSLSTASPQLSGGPTALRAFEAQRFLQLRRLDGSVDPITSLWPGHCLGLSCRFSLSVFFCRCSSRVLGPLCNHLVLATGFASRSLIVYVDCILCLCAVVSARGTRVSLSAVSGVGALRRLLIACCAYARLSLRVGLVCPCLSCAELACWALSWRVRPCGPGSRWYRHCWPRKGALFFLFPVQRDPCPTSAVRGQPGAFFGFLSPVVLLESYFTSPVLTTSQLGLSLFQSLS